MIKPGKPFLKDIKPCVINTYTHTHRCTHEKLGMGDKQKYELILYKT